MKKIFFIAVAMLLFGMTNAQTLYVSNTSCSDIEYIIYAGESPNTCGPTDDDKSAIMSIASGNTISYNFGSGTSATGFTWDGQTTGNPSTVLPGSNFNFFKADVGNPCWTASGAAGSCGSRGGVDLDGTTVWNDMAGGGSACGSPTMSRFFISPNCSNCHACYECCDTIWPMGCVDCIASDPAHDGINVNLTTDGSGNWYLNITP